jgi:predicted RND superfamily exporter protein
MSSCPVCQMKYIPSQDMTCSTCHFDISPYLPTLGELPESYLAKEKAKLQWAIKTWGKLQEANKEFRVQIERLQRENNDRRKKINRMNNKIEEEDEKEFKAQSYLQGQLNKLTIENDELKFKNDMLKNDNFQYNQSVSQAIVSNKDVKAEVKNTSSSGKNDFIIVCGGLLFIALFFSIVSSLPPLLFNRLL